MTPLLAALLLTTVQSPQEPRSLEVPLRVVASAGSSGFRPAEIRDADGRVLTGTMRPGAVYTAAIGTAHGVRMSGLAADENAFELRVDRDDDGDFDEEPQQRVEFGQSVRITIERKRRPGVLGEVEYDLHASRRDGRDSVAFVARYVAEGVVEFGGRKGRIEFRDGLCDGVFDRRDFETGTTVTLDRNGDGKVTDGGEVLYGSQIIEFGGAWFVVEDLSPDGSRVVLRPSPIAVPQLDAPFPEVELQTVAGTDVPLRDRERPLLLMLWASW